jgi:hypothetical protein
MKMLLNWVKKIFLNLNTPTWLSKDSPLGVDSKNAKLP